ncbi:Uncharacterized protein TCM_001504 [Theobroma cacao]|uniref:Uncharacterized protein n=1 Tax=Theobroma cacao TaxID=3641 RepID=A0A061DJM8_THECC|nr:Uncharacterized protein TCM_001504 [Theobroma cacao]
MGKENGTFSHRETKNIGMGLDQGEQLAMDIGKPREQTECLSSEVLKLDIGRPWFSTEGNHPRDKRLIG